MVGGFLSVAPDESQHGSQTSYDGGRHQDHVCNTRPHRVKPVLQLIPRLYRRSPQRYLNKIDIIITTDIIHVKSTHIYQTNRILPWYPPRPSLTHRGWHKLTRQPCTKGQHCHGVIVTVPYHHERNSNKMHTL